MRDRVGGYRLLEALGAGGMAEVFLARREADEAAEVVALKCLRPGLARDPEAALAFDDEARLMRRLADPRIVGYRDSGVDGATRYLALEYVRGPSLARVVAELARAGRHAPAEAVAAVAADLLAALHAAHEALDEAGRPMGVVHRDVSPHNLVLCPSGVCKLVDFGVARSSVQVHDTEDGVLRGKAPYLAPELIATGHLDRRADIWAAALVVYELATLVQPYAGASDLETVQRIHDHPIPPVDACRADLPGAFARVLELALARSHDARFETAQAFREALACALPVDDKPAALRALLGTAFPRGLPNGRGGAAVVPSHPEPPRPWCGWRSGAALLVLVGMALVAAGAIATRLSARATHAAAQAQHRPDAPPEVIR